MPEQIDLFPCLQDTQQRVMEGRARRTVHRRGAHGLRRVDEQVGCLCGGPEADSIPYSPTDHTSRQHGCTHLGYK